MRSVITKLVPGVVAAAAGRAALAPGLVGAGLGLIAKRVALSSVPGAVLVGGVLAVKYLRDKKKGDAREAAPGGVPETGVPGTAKRRGLRKSTRKA